MIFLGLIFGFVLFFVTAKILRFLIKKPVLCAFLCAVCIALGILIVIFAWDILAAAGVIAVAGLLICSVWHIKRR